MAASPDTPLWAAAKDMLLRELIKTSDIETRLTDQEYRAEFRLQIGDALHTRYDFSDNTQSPEAIAEEILETVIEVARHYRKSSQ
ncbi:MAG: hypothetical protein AAF829_09980 [Pseudomonadota bacterium]